MCPNCFSTGVTGFPSYWEFEAFEMELQRKRQRQQLLPVPNAPVLSLTKTTPEQLYQCPACGETWALSSPDNAWRGYFLPLAEAVTYGQQLRRTDRNRRVGCLALVLGLAGFTIWRLFS